MKIGKNIGFISAILGIIAFLDEYLFNSNLLDDLSIPESIPTSIFLIVFSAFCFIFFFNSRKEFKLPYPDQRKEVSDLEKSLQSYEFENKELSNKNQELLYFKNLFENDEYLQDKIHGILLKGSMNSNELISELGIDPKSKDAVANFQAVIGRLGKQGLVSTNSLGYYQLSKKT